MEWVVWEAWEAWASKQQDYDEPTTTTLIPLFMNSNLPGRCYLYMVLGRTPLLTSLSSLTFEKRSIVLVILGLYDIMSILERAGKARHKSKREM